MKQTECDTSRRPAIWGKVFSTIRGGIAGKGVWKHRTQSVSEMEEMEEIEEMLLDLEINLLINS